MLRLRKKNPNVLDFKIKVVFLTINIKLII